MSRSISWLVAVSLFGASILTGCASYEPLPLPQRASLAASLSELRIQRPLSKQLTVSDIAELVLQNSPDLLATRTQRGVAQAALLQAGLPPNPSLTAAILPLAAGVGTTTAWNAGITYDVRSLITLRRRREAAAAQAKAIDATLLWQEWQTVAQARLLTVDIVMGDRTLKLLSQLRNLVSEREQRSRDALAAGNVTLATAAPDLAALQTARTAVADQQRLQLSRRHQLNALLGLRPGVMLKLADPPDLPRFDAAEVERRLPEVTAHRPDLVALQLGYQAQDEKLRVAILSQFPNLSFGVTGGSDNSNVRNVGPQIQLELPIFDRAQGLVASERATRQQLRAEYGARLAAATGQVQALLAEMDLQRQQLRSARRDLQGVRQTANAAQAALQAGNLDERSALDLISARQTKEAEIVTLEQSLMQQQIAIDTLIGAGMPTILTGSE